MNAIVIELQKEALDRNVRLSDLLRKALVVSRKLGQIDFQSWIGNELNGYTKEEGIPEYRKTYGSIKGFNPYYGWNPVHFGDIEIAEKLTSRMAGQTIAELEDILSQAKEGGTIGMPVPVGLQNTIIENTGFRTEYQFILPESQIVKILDAVRTIVLNWALKLEEEGILGENLSFTQEEKEAASKSPQNITNFYGTVQSPQIQQGNVSATQLSVTQAINLKAIRDFISHLKDVLQELKLEKEQFSEVKAELNTIESQLDSPKPKKGIIFESLSYIKRILEEVGSGVAANLAIELGKLIIK